MRAGKKIILAIDDQIPILTSIRTILEGSFEVSLANNAETAKAILQTAGIDVILLDMYYDLPVDTAIASMHKYAKALDYNKIIEKIHFIITLLKVK